MMEGVLERAVSNGADNMVRQMKAVMGDAPKLTGIPEVRGFRLDGYGVFFDVEVPALRLPVTWPLRYMFRDNRETMGIVNELRAMMVESEPRQRERLAQVVRQLEQQAQVTVGAARHRTVSVRRRRCRSAAVRSSAGSRCLRRSRGTLHTRGEGGARGRDDREQRPDRARRRGVAHGGRARQRAARSADSDRCGRYPTVIFRVKGATSLRIAPGG